MSDTDPTAPWFEYLSYLRCCDSLGITPSLGRFMRYENYVQQVEAEGKKVSG